MKQKVVIIGSAGNMGRRYCAILKNVFPKIQVVGVDLKDLWPSKFDKAIIATPTNTHFQICKKLIDKGKTFLCEKPITFRPDQSESIQSYANGFMVNNWCYAVPGEYLVATKNNVDYDYYSTGKDGLNWDCIQLHGLAKTIKLNNKSHVFSALINGIPINREMIDISYVRMLKDFVGGEYERLWDLGFAHKLTEKVSYIDEPRSMDMV